jgi:hypothetical protein
VQALEVPVEVGVGRADQRELAPRDHEDHAVVAGRVIDGAIGEPRQETVDALRPPENLRASLGHTGRRAELVHPGSGRIDHDPRAQGRDLAGQQITRTNAGDRAALVPHDLGHLRVVERARAEAAGREDVLEAEALRKNQQVVEVVAGAAKVAGPQRRLERERVDRGQNPITLALATGREPVVELQADTDLDQAPRRIAIDRHQKRQRPYEMRSQPP